MSAPILDPEFWSIRLAEAQYQHQAVFRCTIEKWKAIEARHRQLLAKLIKPEDSILDAGCAWGRLLDLLPKNWKGAYLGVDLCPEFISMAREAHPDHLFTVGDMRDLSWVTTRFDWAVMISIRPMIRRHLGLDGWNQVEQQLRQHCDKLLFLEYDENAGGQVE